MFVLKPNRGNKTFSSRLTRWVDRLLPLEFEVVHVAGRTLGMADYLSRHPTELQGASLKAESLWNEWFTVNSVISLKDVLEDGEVSCEASQASKAKQIKREVKEKFRQSRKRSKVTRTNQIAGSTQFAGFE